MTALDVQPSVAPGGTGVPVEFDTGAFRPVTQERTEWSLRVLGSLPPELDGVYVRTGPNPPPVPHQGPFHWFVPDGMLHGVRLQSGHANWYRNRWVRTEALAGKLDAPAAGGPVDVALLAGSNTANTSVVRHAGRLFAIAEVGLPHEIDRELQTLGRYDFAGRLRSPMTAHPRVDPVTGDMHMISFGPVPPYLQYHHVDAAGVLTRTEVIDLPRPTLVHDMAITERFVLLFDLPVVFDGDYFAESGFPYRWEPDHQARVGLLPKGGSNSDVRWFHIAPGYFIHTVNAYDDGDAVVLDVARYPRLLLRGQPDVLAQQQASTLHRYTLDLVSGRSREGQLHDLPFEFPKVDEALTGRRHRYAYGVLEHEHDGRTGFGSLVKYDLTDATSQVAPLGPGRVAAEGFFVPAAGATREDDGWLLSYVYDPARDASDLVVCDASDLSKPPQAVVALPQRVPLGFHGTWVPTGG